jgi:predicted dehydrogenase
MGELMHPISFGVVGAGWRAEFFLRIAAAAPDLFAPPLVVARNPEKARRFAATWQCSVVPTVDELLAPGGLDFVVTSVPWEANPQIIRGLVDRGVPVLSETPPAPDLAALIDLWRYVEQHQGRVCVAEQYFLQPYFAAVRQVIELGMVGTVSQAQVSAAHGYHGVSLLRRLLGVGFENATIAARSFTAPVLRGPDRQGPPTVSSEAASTQTFSWLDFDGKLGLADFCGEQYFNWVRNNRVLVRGERGEIINDRVAYLKDFRTPVYLDLLRHNTGGPGNFEGNYLAGIQLGQDMVYVNPLAPAALSDDEIAIGDLLLRMAVYARGGEAPYPLAEACQDHYLGLLCTEALQNGTQIRTESQPWSTG